MMVINNNIPALNAYDVVNNTSNQLQKSIQKLSTGLRINSASDDAAGLSISEKMRAQINGLDQAVRNTQDGVSLIQTAEGALTETHSILQRMRELSVQAANDTYTAQDRSYIQEEVDLLREEIDHIGNTTTFNTKKLLNGDSAALWSSDNLNTKAIIRGGLRTIDQFGQKTSAEGNYKISITSSAGAGEVQKTTQFRIKHAVAENEWEDGVTDGVISGSAKATGYETLGNDGDKLLVYMGSYANPADKTTGFTNGVLAADQDATITAVNASDTALSFGDASTVKLNGLMKLSVKDGAITATFYGNDKDGVAYNGESLVASDSTALTTSNLQSKTLQMKVTDDDGNETTVTLGSITGGNSLEDGDHYYEIVAAGTGDSDAGNGDVVVTVESSTTGKAQQFVMNQSAFDDGNTTNKVEFVTNAVEYDDTAKEYTGVKQNGSPYTATATLSVGSFDVDAVQYNLDTTKSTGVNASKSEVVTGTTSTTLAGLGKGSNVSVKTVAGSAADGTATAVTALANDYGALNWTTAAVNGDLKIDVKKETTAYSITGTFTGIGKDGKVYDGDTIKVINTTGGTNTDVTGTEVAGTAQTLSLQTSDGKVIGVLTTANPAYSPASDVSAEYAVTAAETINDYELQVYYTNGTSGTETALTNAKVVLNALSQYTAGTAFTIAAPNADEGVTLAFDTAPTLAASTTIASWDLATGVSGDEALATFNMKEGEADDSTIGQIANYETKLRDLQQFWDSQGNFMLEDPQTITITQGDGQTAKVTLYKYDTVGDMTDKINSAIANDLGQAKYTDDTGAKNFATFVSNEDNDDYDGTAETSEAVEGTMLIRSIVPGSTGTLSFASNNEDLINALGLNTIQSADDSTYTVTITDAHSGDTLVNAEKITGNVLVGKLHPNVDVEFDAMSGITATWDDTQKKFTMSNSDDATVTYLHLSDNTTVFQIGANEGDDMGINIGDMRSHALGLDGVLVTDHKSASRSISIIDSAIDKVSTQRAKLGAYQNRLEHTAANLTTSAENLTAAESRIRDTDMAKEMMNFTKLQIMLQAGNSMLAQANQLPQNVLSLIR